MVYQENLIFKGDDFQLQELTRGEYENCTFTDCNFANTNLSGLIFIDCAFVCCDMSMAVLGQTSFRDVKFRDCKLLGLHFNNCSKFLLSMQFEDSVLNFSSFYQVSLKKAWFSGCKLQEVDFVESNLDQTSFLNCDFFRAIFNNTVLEGADLSTSYNFSINPANNRIKKAKFSRENVMGLLEDFGIIIE